MKNIIRKLFIFTSLYVLFFYGCGQQEEGRKESTNIAVKDTIPVQIAKAEKRDLNVSKTFSGNLEGKEQANIVARMPERIVSIKVKVGDQVSTGQLIIELDKSGATSQYYQAQAGFLNAGKDLDRMKALYAEGAISQQMLDGVQTVYNIAKANFDAAKSTVELTTPISGVVASVNASVGDLASPGVPVVVIASISKMKVIFNVGEGDIANLSVGQLAEINSELKPLLIQRGSISQISRSADIQSRSFEIKALFNNTSDRWFKPGMFCKAKVSMKSQKGSLVIPNVAIINQQDGKGVFTVENGKANFKTIETGLTDGTYTEILSGLREGETIVTVGNNNLKEGSIVHIAYK